MRVKDIDGDYDSMVVTFEDGRKVEFGGELLADGFVAFENSARKWVVPDGEPISDRERKEIIEAVLDDVKQNQGMKITFETYRPPTKEEKEASLRSFIEELKKDGFDVKVN